MEPSELGLSGGADHGGQVLGVQGVAQHRVGRRPRCPVVDVAALWGGELHEEEVGVLTGAAVLDQPGHQVALVVVALGGDPQGQRPGARPTGQGQRIPGVGIHHMHLVTDRAARIAALEPRPLARQGLQHAVGGRMVEPVGIDLEHTGQPPIQLDHAPAQVEDTFAVRSSTETMTTSADRSPSASKW
jgi:hypothetical protein